MQTSSMPFSIGLPPGTRDLSTFIYALPSSSSPAPSVVIRAELPGPGDEPWNHLMQARQALQAHVKHLVIKDESRVFVREWASATTLIEFQVGEQPAVHQRQYYILVHQLRRMYTMHFTALPEVFPSVQSSFQAMFASWQPM